MSLNPQQAANFRASLADLLAAKAQGLDPQPK